MQFSKRKSQRKREKAGSAGGLSSQSPALSQDKLTLSQRQQELLLLLFAVLKVVQAPLDKESCSTKVMKTCRELPFALVSKVGARVNSSKWKRRETQCEGGCSSVEVSRGRREEVCRGMSREVGKVEQVENGFAVFARTRTSNGSSSE